VINVRFGSFATEPCRASAKQCLLCAGSDDGTNTKDEKAAFIAATFEAMGKILGPLHEESYVHVHDVRDDAYGYGGLTQGQRYIARKLAARVATAA
jgi:4-oxalocrotonate tautomerase